MVLVNPSQAASSASFPPTPVTVELLVEIWRSVLKRSSLGLDDDFFQMGGSIRSADLLFAEIAQKLGRELPTATIFRAPTIASLASLLDQAVLPRFSPFIQLRAGVQHPKILIAPGLMVVPASPASPSWFAPPIRSMGFRPRVSTGWKSRWTALKTWPSSIWRSSTGCNPKALTF